MFRCSKCKVVKPPEAFPYGKGVRHCWCRLCVSVTKKEKLRVYRLTHPRKKRARSESVTPSGLIICSKCCVPQAPQCYAARRPGWCRSCRSKKATEDRRLGGTKERRRSVIENGAKLCMACDNMRPLVEFVPSPRGLGGVAAYCRACLQAKPKNKETARLATKRYRERHRCRHLAAHRVRMWERKHRIRVTRDGSVTDAFLKALYTQPVCHYCEETIPEHQRTADHRQPLSKGGGHVASNLVMACWTCNCSKRDRSEEEFKSYLMKQRTSAHLPPHASHTDQNP